MNLVKVISEDIRIHKKPNLWRPTPWTYVTPSRFKNIQFFESLITEKEILAAQLQYMLPREDAIRRKQQARRNAMYTTKDMVSVSWSDEPDIYAFLENEGPKIRELTSVDILRILLLREICCFVNCCFLIKRSAKRAMSSRPQVQMRRVLSRVVEAFQRIRPSR